MSQEGNSRNLFNWTHLTIGVLGLLVSAAALPYATGWKPTLFGKNDRFTCGTQPDTSRGGEVWTVFYHNDKGKQPWLKMVHTLGDGWDTGKRCGEIAERLEGYRKDGLINFYYRPDPKTPTQDVICAKTRLSSENGCELVVTLIPGANGYESLGKMTEALRSGKTVDQRSGAGASEQSSIVDVSSFLADEDLKAGSGTK